ncbi:hypothetical protein BGZ83_002727 [Gryganskiella cystojenkinii]|nr:hypothetical protein BGZ83_002727 [Gryganskiella cystojenkinii]
MYVLKDLLSITALVYCASLIKKLPLLSVRIFAWIAYWIAQGTVMEDTANDLDNHHHHHEEALISETPIYTLGCLVGILTLGWPLYLLTNFGGHDTPHWVHHLRSNAPHFEPHQVMDLFYGNCGVASMVFILTYFSIIFSPLAVVMFYGIPHLGFNAWIVCITYLQHTDPQVPHFRGNEWNFQRGAACTVDRSFGRIVDHLHHYAAITHALYRNWRECKFVEDEGDIVFYKT